MAKQTVLALLLGFYLPAQARVCVASLLQPQDQKVFLSQLYYQYQMDLENNSEIDLRQGSKALHACLAGDYQGVFILAHTKITAIGDGALVTYYKDKPMMLPDGIFNVDLKDSRKIYVAACAENLINRYPNLMSLGPVFARSDYPADANQPINRVSLRAAASHLRELLSSLGMN